MAENYNDLLAFVAVAREGSFTKAAKQMGVSQSALSHTIRALETRLGIRLLTRTTRSVSPTDAGQRLLQTLAPRFEEIDIELAALTELRDKPAGTIRITCAEHAANGVLWPKLAPLLAQYPDIKIDINVDYGMTNIVEQRYDAGVRLGDQVEKDMIAVRICADMRMAVVAAPSYFARHPKPLAPRELQEHNCINLRLPTHGNLLVWDFEKAGEAVNVRVASQPAPVVSAAVTRCGNNAAPCSDPAPAAATATSTASPSELPSWCATLTKPEAAPASRGATPAMPNAVSGLKAMPCPAPINTIGSATPSR